MCHSPEANFRGNFQNIHHWHISLECTHLRLKPYFPGQWLNASLLSRCSGDITPCFISWRHQMETFPHYWPFVRGIHRSPVNSPHKGQWRGALMFSLFCAWIHGWANNCESGDLMPSRPLWRHCNEMQDANAYCLADVGLHYSVYYSIKGNHYLAQCYHLISTLPGPSAVDQTRFYPGHDFKTR